MSTRALLAATLSGGTLCLFVPATASALHSVGIPHYSRNEQDPQTLDLTYRVDAGPYEVTAIAHPGVLRPGERCRLQVTITRRATGAAFEGPVRLTVIEDRMIGTDPVVSGPVVVQPQPWGYGFEPRFLSEANYLARVEFEAEGESWKIDLPIVAGKPGSPWTVVVGALAGTAVFLVIVQAARVKMGSVRRAPSAGRVAGR
jgi:hypothetical protein